MHVSTKVPVDSFVYPFPCQCHMCREEEMQVLNRATNTKMATFSFLSIFVCLSVAGLQLWHLKTFFERKKLI